MEQEIWKDIVGYEGLYQVSNHGSVKSLERIVPHSSNGTYSVKEKILKGSINNNGYHHVCLHKTNKKETIEIQRLVARAFLLNPEKLPQVNHIDGIKTNNRVGNLEWCTGSKNMEHAHKCGLQPAYSNNQLKQVKDLGLSNGKKVMQFDLHGNFINQFDSTKEASRKLNISDSCIGRVCRNERKQTSGFKFQYA